MLTALPLLFSAACTHPGFDLTDWLAGEGHFPAGIWQEGCVQQLHKATSCGRAAAAGHGVAGVVELRSTFCEQAAAGPVQPNWCR